MMMMMIDVDAKNIGPELNLIFMIWSEIFVS